MKTFVGLIRGINVGGNKIVKMAEFRAMLEELGYIDVKTLLQSGNFVFKSDNTEQATKIRKAMKEQLGVDAVVLVYTADDWQRFMGENPMPKEASEHSSRFQLCLAEKPINAGGLKEAMARAIPSEKVCTVNGRLYLSLPEGVGTSKMLASREWAKFAGAATMRNWNTVTKLAELAKS